MPDELPDDPFDRQRCIEDFRHQLIEQQVAFVLGVGGVGNAVAMALCRMGVKKVFLLDYDVVDTSNLNRQVLFSRRDAGRRKVDAAVVALRHHNIHTELVPLHANAVTRWHTVVEVARQCTVVFNNIDYGCTFDYAVRTLCAKLRIRYLAANTYAHTAILEFHPNTLHDPQWPETVEAQQEFKADPVVLAHWMRLRGMPADAPLDLHSVLEFLDECFVMKEVADLVALEMQRIAAARPGADNVHVAADAAAAAPLYVTPAELCGVLVPALREAVLQRLSCEHIESWRSIGFIPKNRMVATRSVGSWVAVCVGGSLMLVNLWVQSLMGEKAHTWAALVLRDMSVEKYGA